MIRSVPVVAILAGAGVTAVIGLTQFDARPHAIGQPAAVFGQRTPLLTATTPVATRCVTVPAKAWGTRPPVVTTVNGVVYTIREKPPWWHYSTLILKPTRIERYCVSYPAAGGTRVNVTAGPVKP